MIPALRLHRRAAAALAAAALAAASMPALAAPAQRPLSQSATERWTYRDGLPHNVVHRLLASRGGYLWIGSQEGLVRFDGVRFKVFAQRDTPGLAGNEINALMEDERGTLWVGTSLGLSRLAGSEFELVDLGGDAAVTDLASDGEGGAWVATEANGVVRVRAGRPARVDRLDGLPDPRVLALFRAGQALWIGGYGGLSRLAGGRLENLGHTGPSTDAVTRIMEGRDGTLWVGTAAGLARRRPGAARVERTPFAGSTMVSALAEDRTGALWVGTENGPVVRLVDERAEPVGGAPGLSAAHALTEDRDGNLWLGTESGGLFRLRWGQAMTIATEEGLAADVVWAVHGGRGGITWVASDGGLDRIAADRPRRVLAPELSGETLGGLLEDRAGDLWVGTVGGVLRFGPGGVTRYGRAQGLNGSLARTFHEDARGTIWVGTSHGLFRLANGRFQPLATDPKLAGDKLNVLAELPDGSLWAGATTGLARVEGDRLVAVAPAGQPLRGDVTALHGDADGTLWIGTVGAGLARLAAGRLQRWTRREGLHEDTVLAILDDRAGHLWLSGTHGITRVARTDLEEVAAGRRTALAPLVLGAADGMRDRECNGGVTPSAWRGEDGRLWFATIRGAVVVDPARPEAPRGPPPVAVEELVVDGHPWPPGAPLRFPPGSRRVEVRYTGLALADADRLRFRHRLAGLDDAFVDAAGARTAHFTNLGPGRHVFEVEAASGAGEWGPPASVAFEIEPHPWQRPWFAAALALAAVGLALGTHLSRTRALRRHEALLAARVEEEMRKVKILRGLIPTCAWCSKIRDEGGDWHRFEDYVTARSEARFTHGMCPSCYARMGDGEGPRAKPER